MRPTIIEYRERINQKLEHFLPAPSQKPQRLHQAMQYCLLSSGKRLRSSLVYEVGYTLGISLNILDYPAAAIEMAHSFSLIHDDLPALDNDDLRRGIPTCHKQFDEATAILTGDALLVLSYKILAQTPLKSPEIIIQMMEYFSESLGSEGLIGGEMLDIEGEHQNLSQDDLLLMCEWKTARLIQASLVLGAMTAGLPDLGLIPSLKEYGKAMGLAFQIQDDILDAEGKTQLLGKSKYSDKKNQKATLPLLQSIERAKKIRDEYYQKGCSILKKMPFSFNHLNEHITKTIYRSY